MIRLFQPYMPVELPELNEILHSGALSYGKWGKLFEQNLAIYTGESKIATFSSYNAAMLVALTAIGVQPGDEIIASPMSCLASSQPFATQHLKVVWADIDPKSGTLCPESVRSKITHKTKAIFHNHYGGYPGYIDEINLIGKEKGIVVVDDANEAFGAEYKGNRLGHTGTDMTIFSFQTIRIPNTIEGGGISFHREDLYKKALLIRDHGIDRIRFRDELGEINPSCDIALPGYGATLNEVNSYIGVLQMGKTEELIQIQRKNAARWKTILSSKISNYELVGSVPDRIPNYWIFGLLSSERNQLMEQFRREGYYASKVHLPNHYYSVFGSPFSLPGVEEFYSKFLALPSGWWVGWVEL